MSYVQFLFLFNSHFVGGNRPPRTPMGPEPLFGSAGGGGCTKSRSRRHTHKDFTQLRAARMCKTLLLLVWIDSSSCSGMQEATVSLELDVGGCLLGILPLYVAWASFYMLKGLPTCSDAGEGKNVNRLCVQCRTVLSYLLLTAGDKGIKCPSRSLGQHRGGPLGAPPFATMAVACHRAPQAAQCPATCLWGSPGATRGRVSWCAGLRWRLAAVVVFPRLRACRSSGLAGAHGASRRASLVVPGFGVPGGLLPPGPWCF